MNWSAKYKIKPPFALRKFFPGTTWRINNNNKQIYITFDDGPIPKVTPWVVDCLKRHNATATFFCVGDNVRKYPDVFSILADNGMAVGNHTFSHCRAWNMKKKDYLGDVDKCREFVKSPLFRPPHGQIYPWWMTQLKKRFSRIVMWDILSLDYDNALTAEEVANNVITRIRPGSIIVFHDSLKAWERLKDALPKVLEYAEENGYKTEIIS